MILTDTVLELRKCTLDLRSLKNKGDTSKFIQVNDPTFSQFILKKNHSKNSSHFQITMYCIILNQTVNTVNQDSFTVEKC